MPYSSDDPSRNNDHGFGDDDSETHYSAENLPHPVIWFLAVVSFVAIVILLVISFRYVKVYVVGAVESPDSAEIISAEPRYSVAFTSFSLKKPFRRV